MTISPHTDGRIAAIRTDYEALLPWGEALNPQRKRKDACGRLRPRYPTNLLRRLRRYRDDVLRFLLEPDVPFTNNLDEQAVRMPKVKQGVAGSFSNPP